MYTSLARDWCQMERQSLYLFVCIVLHIGGGVFYIGMLIRFI